jgi:hypothetical protein
LDLSLLFSCDQHHPQEAVPVLFLLLLLLLLLLLWLLLLMLLHDFHTPSLH